MLVVAILGHLFMAHSLFLKKNEIQPPMNLSHSHYYVRYRGQRTRLENSDRSCLWFPDCCSQILNRIIILAGVSEPNCPSFSRRKLLDYLAI
jgi:hypothetical protein